MMPSTPPSAQDGTMPGGGGSGVQVAVVQAPPVRGVLPEHRDLAFEAVDRPPHVRLAGQHRGVVDQIPGGEVVGAVHDQVVLLEQLDGVARVQPELVQIAPRPAG